ncbi:peptidoglycan D,D-transpeptidase FtsI family protein [Propionibacterium australiense]|uniref:Penicillin binding protein transpeptidase domain n=1 Tax=Propionibacterium australiense TaxID=119981 RepID=A0A383S548_9ACTN|nr:penicillin-binding protein 2 [Propionibacterium australiense]RLP08199.1 penicillin-binding protein 2 [Propionibacterium australiense]RLP08273.1 penicillin-binding protein 2 [Propionibacterium australiense]SYZ33115.1 Penicillin binding protein transpeptidase domain [Propionibacterium australiense]VEH89131.1 Penicillin-binding protein A [Propionibacterium australiense]
MNKALRKVSVFAALMVFALLANVTFNYGLRSGALLSDPGNRRVVDAQFDSPRGSILVGTTAVAETVPVEGGRFSVERVYSNGPLYAPVTGYYSYIYGRTGLEQRYNDELSGSGDSQLFRRILSELSGNQPQGDTIQTTIDANAQQAASDALGGRTGAVIAMDYTTGAILAWASTPSYDPNLLSSTNLASTQTAWDELNADESHPLKDRATQEIYPPGSTFKLVVASAALEGGMSADSTVASPTTLPLDNSTTTLPNSTDCGGDTTTIDHALQVSCNTAFANLGMDLGQDKVREQAEKFGFNAAFGGDVDSATSVFPADLDNAQLAMSSIGQFDVSATPLQMASVAATLANDGQVMQPYVVSQVRDSNLHVISETRPTTIRRAVSEETAASMRQMMVHVVESGTATATQISGQTIGGKTGTAENMAGASAYSWFAGFDQETNVALAVFLADPDQPGTATGNATVAARTVFEAFAS